MRLNAALIDHLVAHQSAAVPVLRELRAELRSTVGGLHPPAEPMEVPFLVESDDHEHMRRGADVLVTGLAALPEMVFGDLETAIRELRVPQAIAPFLKEDIPLGVRLARSDFLRGPDGWRLCEINVTGAAGGLAVGDYDDVVRRYPLVADFLTEHRLASVSPISVLAGAVTERCAGLAIDDRPAVAVMDWQGVGAEQETEQRRIADLYQAHGFDAMLCHHREVRYRAGRLWLGRRPIQVVHRAFLLEDLPTDPASAMPVLEAAADGSIVLISTFRDEWLAGKAAFALLHEAVRRGLLDRDTSAAVGSLVPPTWLLAGEGAGQRGPWLSLPELRGRSPGELVLKPANGSGGAGVVLGVSTPEPAFWSSAEQAAREDRTHVVQDLIMPDPVPFPSLDGGRLVVSPWQPLVGMFQVDGEDAGMWVRMRPGVAPGMIGRRFHAPWSGGWAPVVPQC
ncbi:hypothetical protein [Actinophytocola algeriensis]|uniref:Circularly permuted ATP-grasp superfamily protein n=1 Tax=Actinophytocola algeriensis TaxID=1768010 RepID=A0A7W7QDJ9_9PSEU|nr:hypothetical protein [Actinophytocola algeriensis]MBB4911574.1 hypothetical protein [Actinophytocola algeriensis]MBE1473438.1 hypothetical protein [Actinophytocola algeriensis]